MTRANTRAGRRTQRRASFYQNKIDSSWTIESKIATAFDWLRAELRRGTDHDRHQALQLLTTLAENLNKRSANHHE